MDLIDRKLLNLIQSKFPMVDRPYVELAEGLEIGEADVIFRLEDLKRQNVVRQISAIFDTRRLGYKTTLVAMAYEPEELNAGALFINRHPGVSTITPARVPTTTCGSPWPSLPMATCKAQWTGWRRKPGP